MKYLQLGKQSALLGNSLIQDLMEWAVILQSTHLIEQAFWELLEALSTYKTLLMIQLSVAVHNPLRWFKATFASLAHGISQSICHVAEIKLKG